MKRLAFLLCLLIEVLSLFGKEGYSFLNIGLREGLSNEFVNDMVMDEQGFLWVATESGLNRIAGNKCTVFKTSNSNIGDDGFVGLYYHQPSNSVWMQFKNGNIDVFDCKTQTFKHFTHQNGMLQESVSAIHGASDGGMWIAYYSGDIQHYNIKKQKFTTYSKRLFPKNKNGVRYIMDDGNDHLYVGLRMDGMYVYNLRTRKAKFYNHNPKDEQSLPGNNVRSICIDHMKNIWVGTNLGLALFDEASGKFRTFKPEKQNFHTPAGNNIYQIMEMDNHTLWIASDIGGISILDLNRYQHPYTEELSFQQITKENSGLSSNNTRRIIQDSFGNVWIGNFSSGIDFIPQSTSAFHTLGNLQQPLKNTFGIFCDRQGYLWIGQDNIICQYQNGQTIHRWDFSQYLYNTSATVYNFIEDHQGNIWFGTSDNGALKFNPRTQQFTHHLRIQGLDVHALYESKNGWIWIGSEDGLYTIHQGIEHKETEMNKQMGKTNIIIYSIQEDEYGQLWIGSIATGVFVFNKHKKLIAHLDDQNGLKSNSVNQIIIDSNNGVWIGTYKGLAYIENPLKPQNIKIYDERQGLKDTHIRAICADKLGNIWVSMFSGIACLNLHKQRFYNYDFQSGITMGNFVEAASAMTPDGTIYFGSPSGVCYFNPQLLSGQKTVSQVEIIGCERVGRLSDQFLHRLISPNEEGVVRLKYDDNTFKISFTTKNFAEEGKVEYSYMMKGLDDQWYETEGDKDVTFRNLKPGNYTFIIRAKLKNQDWDEASSTELKVIVTPPFWLTWWAKLSYTLLALGIISFLLRSYQKELLLRNSLARTQWESQQKQEVNEERLRFFTNITHELRTPLTLILGPLEDLMEDKRLPDFVTKKIGNIHASAERLLYLINDILEFRKTETQNRKLSVARENLGQLIREIGMRFQDLNHNSKLKILVDVQEGMAEIYFDSEVITTVVNNLMSNAIKYTPAGSIILSLNKIDNESVRISVEDTGYGIDKEALPHICDRYYQENGKHQASGTGIGLALVKSLAQLHEAELQIDSQKGEGSKFSFILKKSNTYPDALHKDDEKIDLADAINASSTEDLKENYDSEENAENQRPLLLIVEDNSDIRQYIEESLKEDYRILQACNGKEGKDLALDQMPDLIVSDIMMPEMDGIEMTRILKEDIRTSHIPIILLTAKTSATDQQEGYDSGADSYLMKPFSAKLLLSRIRNILSGRRRLAEYIVQQNFSTTLSKENLNKKEKFSDEKKLSDGNETTQEAGTNLPAAHLSELDRKFLEKLNNLIEKHISTDDLDIAFMTDKMAMSHSTFYRKVKALTGMRANEYIKKAKLRKSMMLLQNEQYCISEVAMLTGFNNVGNFRESFKREFGMTPSEVRNHK